MRSPCSSPHDYVWSIHRYYCVDKLLTYAIPTLTLFLLPWSINQMFHCIIIQKLVAAAPMCWDILSIQNTRRSCVFRLCFGFNWLAHRFVYTPPQISSPVLQLECSATLAEPCTSLPCCWEKWDQLECPLLYSHAYKLISLLNLICIFRFYFACIWGVIYKMYCIIEHLYLFWHLYFL